MSCSSNFLPWTPKIISPEGNLCVKGDPSLVPVAHFDRHACWRLLLLLGAHMPGQLSAAEPAVQIDYCLAAELAGSLGDALAQSAGFGPAVTDAVTGWRCTWQLQGSRPLLLLQLQKWQVQW